MPARTKGRAKFDSRGRSFLWWIDVDRWLRIVSRDKKFVIAVPVGKGCDEPGSILVIGTEFPGLDFTEPRPVRLVVPPFGPNTSMGLRVDRLLRWSFDSSHELRRVAEQIRFN